MYNTVLTNEIDQNNKSILTVNTLTIQKYLTTLGC